MIFDCPVSLEFFKNGQRLESHLNALSGVVAPFVFEKKLKFHELYENPDICKQLMALDEREGVADYACGVDYELSMQILYLCTLNLPPEWFIAKSKISEIFERKITEIFHLEAWLGFEEIFIDPCCNEAKCFINWISRYRHSLNATKHLNFPISETTKSYYWYKDAISYAFVEVAAAPAKTQFLFSPEICAFVGAKPGCAKYRRYKRVELKALLEVFVHNLRALALHRNDMQEFEQATGLLRMNFVPVWLQNGVDPVILKEDLELRVRILSSLFGLPDDLLDTAIRSTLFRAFIAHRHLWDVLGITPEMGLGIPMDILIAVKREESLRTDRIFQIQPEFEIKGVVRSAFHIDISFLSIREYVQSLFESGVDVALCARYYGPYTITRHSITNREAIDFFEKMVLTSECLDYVLPHGAYDFEFLTQASEVVCEYILRASIRQCIVRPGTAMWVSVGNVVKKPDTLIRVISDEYPELPGKVFASLVNLPVCQMTKAVQLLGLSSTCFSREALLALSPTARSALLQGSLQV